MLIGILSDENVRMWHFNTDLKMLRNCQESTIQVRLKELATKVLMSMLKNTKHYNKVPKDKIKAWYKINNP